MAVFKKTYFSKYDSLVFWLLIIFSPLTFYASSLYASSSVYLPIPPDSTQLSLKKSLCKTIADSVSSEMEYILQFQHYAKRLTTPLKVEFNQVYCQQNSMHSFDGGDLFRTAAFYNNTDIIELLITEYGVDINTKDKHGKTFLDWLLLKIKQGALQVEQQNKYYQIEKLITVGYGAKTAEQLTDMPIDATKLCVYMSDYKALKLLCIIQAKNRVDRWHGINNRGEKVNVQIPEDNNKVINAIYPSVNGYNFAVLSQEGTNNKLNFYDSMSLFHKASFEPLRTFNFKVNHITLYKWLNDYEVLIEAKYDLRMQDPIIYTAFQQPKMYKFNLDNHKITGIVSKRTETGK